MMIAMTHHDHDEYTTQAIRSLAANTKREFTFLLIDDGSEEQFVMPTKHMLPGPVIHCRRSDAVGAIRSWNLAWEVFEASERFYRQHLVITNNDVVFCRGWEAGLQDAFIQHPDCGIAGPMTNQPGHQPEQLIDIQDRHEFAQEAGRCEYSDAEPVPFVNGFCFMLRRDRMAEKAHPQMGPFYGQPLGELNYGGEDEYQKRMARENLQAYMCPDSRVYHYRHVSIHGKNVDRLSGKPLPRLEMVDTGVES